MLREFVAPHELEEAESLTASSIFLLPIHYSIRHQRLGIFPEAKCTVLAYPTCSPILWMIIRRNLYTRPHVFIGSQSQCFISESDIDAFLIETMPYLLELDEFATRILGTRISRRMIDLLSRHFDFSAHSYLAKYFIVDDTKHQEIINTEVHLPNGYSFVDLNPDVDAGTVAKSWKFSSAGERDQFVAKIRHLPSVGIRSTNGCLASFIVLDASGFFNNQYTVIEHRQKGLANFCEHRLCQRVILFGLHPIKFVEQDNEAVVSRSMRSPWWTTVTDETGLPVLNDHRLVYRRN